MGIKNNAEEQQRLRFRLQLETAKVNQKAVWDSCEHVAGCNKLSDAPNFYTLTSIVWHQFRDGVKRGICTVCQRWFNPEDPDYRYWINKKSLDKSSASDDGNWKPIPKEEMQQAIEESRRQFSGFDGKPYKPLCLDDLSDKEIKELYKDTLYARRLVRGLVS